MWSCNRADFNTVSEDSRVSADSGVKFSNGNPLTADMVVRNLQRLAAENSRFAYVGDFDISAADDKTVVVIGTKDVS